MNGSPLDWLRSRGGGWSLSKCGYLLFCVVFTYKMVRDLPSDPWLWLIYGATVGSVQVLQKLIAARFAAPTPEPGQTP